MKRNKEGINPTCRDIIIQKLPPSKKKNVTLDPSCICKEATVCYGLHRRTGVEDEQRVVKPERKLSLQYHCVLLTEESVVYRFGELRFLVHLSAALKPAYQPCEKTLAGNESH